MLGGCVNFIGVRDIVLEINEMKEIVDYEYFTYSGKTFNSLLYFTISKVSSIRLIYKGIHTYMYLPVYK